MIKPTLRNLEALAQVSLNKEFLSYLEVRKQEYVKQIILAVDEVQMRLLQGKAQEVSELLNLINEAPAIVRKA